MSAGKFFHLYAVNEKTGEEICMTQYPTDHKSICGIKSKLSNHPARRLVVREEDPIDSIKPRVMSEEEQKQRFDAMTKGLQGIE